MGKSKKSRLSLFFNKMRSPAPKLSDPSAANAAEVGITLVTKTPQAKAEEAFKIAADKLEKAAPEESAIFPISDTASLQAESEDVEGVAEKIASEIDRLIDSRVMLRATETRPNMVKDFAESWFRALFPFIKVSASQASVSP
jgi:hypothetical protein